MSGSPVAQTVSSSKGITVGTARIGAYRSWASMIQRCTNPNRDGFARYGGRGISVCERWRDFKNFYADMGDRPQGMSLDRFPDADGNYEPGNCRWATQSQQNVNKNLKPRPAYNRLDLTGRRFGRLVVTAMADPDAKSQQTRWYVDCDCGVARRVIGTSLTSGRTRSCGCLRHRRRSSAGTFVKGPPNE